MKKEIVMLKEELEKVKVEKRGNGESFKDRN
jgi:hypothetical protein